MVINVLTLEKRESRYLDGRGVAGSAYDVKRSCFTVHLRTDDVKRSRSRLSVSVSSTEITVFRFC